MKSIVVRSPTRVDLAGGTLDLWPLYNFVGGAMTVNVAIDIYTEARIDPLPKKKVELVSEDLGLRKTYASLDECLKDQDKKLHLLQAQLNYWRPQQGFRLTTRSQSPVGGGLGGSSSLTISLLRAFAKFCKKPAGSIHKLVNVAHNIEAEVLNTPTGTQDYYPAACGGLNILRYSSDGISQKILPIDAKTFVKSFLLVYTGKAHHSGLNNFEVLQRAVAADSNTLQALKDLKLVAEEMVEVCKGKSWSHLGELFRREYEARVRLAPAFSSPEIEKLSQVAMQAGADAVKICGAGGGGCVLVWVDPERREGVREACQRAGFQVLNAKPVGPLKVR